MIFRTSKNKENPYVMVNKTLVHDKRLSLEAMGLAVYCLSMPDNWEFHLNQLGQALNQGRDKMRRMMKELIDCGYCVLDVERNKGQYSKYHYTLLEEPVLKEKVPQPEKPAAAEPTLANPTLINTDLLVSTKEEIYIPAPKKKQRKAEKPLWKDCDLIRLLQEDYDWLVSKHGAKDVDFAIVQMDNWLVREGRSYQNYRKEINAWIERDKAKPQKQASFSKPADFLEANREYAQKRAREINEDKTQIIYVTAVNDHLRITYRDPKYQGEEVLAYKEYGFKEQLENKLRVYEPYRRR